MATTATSRGVLAPGCDLDLAPGLRRLAHRQAGVVTRRRLSELGVSYRKLDAQVRARRWTTLGPECVLLHNARPSRHQLMWVAVLHAPHGCLASATALTLHGFMAFSDERVHLLTPRGTTVWKPVGTVLHESRRLDPGHIVHRDGLPTTGVERSAIDRAAWQRHPQFAAAVRAAVVQQGLTCWERLDTELDTVGSVRHAAVMRLAIRDIEGGARALSEIDLAKVCRRYGLAPPHRQRVRRDRAGRRRYIDAEWKLPDGRLLMLEVDGAHHLDVQHWEEDIKRQRALTTDTATMLRCTAMELRLSPLDVVTDLAANGVPRVVTAARRRGIAGE